VEVGGSSGKTTLGQIANWACLLASCIAQAAAAQLESLLRCAMLQQVAVRPYTSTESVVPRILTQKPLH